MKKSVDGRTYKKYIFISMSAVFAAILLAFIYLGVGTWREYKKAIIDNQKNQMLLTAQSLGDNLEVLIDAYVADLEGLCAIRSKQSPGTEQENWRLLREYVDSHGPLVFDVLLEDQTGAVLKSCRGYGITETYSVTVIDGETSLNQSELEDGKIYLTVKRRLEDGNSLSIVIDEREYYESVISGIHLGTNGYVVLKDSKGVILMHPEQQQWGIEVIEGRKELYPEINLDSLEAMIERQNRGEEGVSEYYSYWWTKPGHPRVKKISAYSPVILGESFLVVSAVIDYDDIFIPVAEGFLKLLLVFLGILAAILLMASYMVSLLLQKGKDTEKIVYLTELNRILEGMRQSEETIAHQQRLQIMGTMTGGIAHEFNNLLTPIMGYADLMLAEIPEDSELYDSAREIYDASSKAKEIIQQISSLSRKNMETAYKNMSALKMLRRALKMVRSVCPANVSLEEKIRLEEECVLGNETQMNQVILNICVNAIHAIGHKEDGRIIVTCSAVERSELEACRPGEVPGNWRRYVRIDIADNGCGMNKDILAQIFDPFFTTKKGGQGTGLGLALVEQIISSHKGCITAESEPGTGSVFHIFLPVNEQKRTETADAPEQSAGGENAANLRLLIVDDNPKVLKLLEKSFGKSGVSLTCCMDFEEAGRQLESRPFDALAAEQEIAGASGVDFCMAVQGRYPGLIRIIMTDRITKEIVEAKQRRVIDAYIDKPVSDSSILEAVRCQNEDGKNASLNNF